MRHLPRRVFRGRIRALLARSGAATNTKASAVLISHVLDGFLLEFRDVDFYRAVLRTRQQLVPFSGGGLYIHFRVFEVTMMPESALRSLHSAWTAGRVDQRSRDGNRTRAEHLRNPPESQGLWLSKPGLLQVP